MTALELSPIEKLAASSVPIAKSPAIALPTSARHSSESNEHFTPAPIVEAARRTLGRIDLDPATCEFANRLVGADVHYTKEDDGLSKEWRGRVFLNPPGGRIDGASSAKVWWFKLEREWSAGRVEAGIFVAFSVEILQTTQVATPDGAAIPLDFPICFPARRVAYDRCVDDGRERGSSPPHASAIVCVSTDRDVVARFVEAFSPIGRVVGAWRP